MKTLDYVARRFLREDTLRPAMMKFHKDEDKIVATDGHAMIVAPCSYFSGKYEAVEKFPNYRSVIPPPDETSHILKVEWLESIRNKIPTEPIYENCAECDGDGYQECNLGHTHDCEECDGTGNGRKVIGEQVSIGHHTIQFAGVYFNPNLLYRALDVAKTIEVDELIVTRVRPTGACLMLAKDIQIVIMPMDPETIKDSFGGIKVHRIKEVE